MNRFERVTLSLLLVAAFCAGCLDAQTLVQRVPAPASAAKMWQHDRDCSGIRPAPGLGLDAVVWVVGVWGVNADSSVTLGEWLPPDTIALLPITYQSPLIVAHELMHHLLQGPDGEDHHPQAFYDCDLMPEQHPADSATQLIGLEPKPFRRRAPGPHLSPEIVQRWNACLDRFHCSGWAPYAHGEDPQTGRVDWLVSISGHACEVAPGAPYRLNEFFTCEWRTPRGGTAPW